MVQPVENGERLFVLEKVGKKDGFIIWGRGDTSKQEELLYKTSPSFRGLYEEAEQILRIPIAEFRFAKNSEYRDSLTTHFISRFLYNYYVSIVGPKHDLAYRRPRIVSADASVSFVNALVLAGSLNFEGGLNLESSLADAYKSVPPVKIFEIELDWQDRIKRTNLHNLNVLMQEFKEKGVYLSARYSDFHLRFAGLAENIEDANRKLFEMERVVKMTPYDGIPFHTPFMEEAAEPVASALSTITIQDPQIPVVALTNGKVITTAKEVEEEILAQITQPILINEVRNTMKRQGVPFPLEIAYAAVETAIEHPTATTAILLFAAGVATSLAIRQRRNFQGKIRLKSKTSDDKN